MSKAKQKKDSGKRYTREELEYIKKYQDKNHSYLYMLPYFSPTKSADPLSCIHRDSQCDINNPSVVGISSTL